MPEPSHAHEVKKQKSLQGLPLHTSMGIFCASLISGALISIWLGGLGWPFFGLFILAALVLVIVTETRGLAMLVASMPILFAIALLSSAWFLVRDGAADGAPVSKTQIITAVYPLAQHFPILIAVTLAAAIIAFLRVKFLSGSTQKHANERLSAQRQREREADRRNRRAASRARKQSKESQVTVDELLQKSRGHNKPAATKPSGPRPRPQRREYERSRERAGYPDPGALRIRPEDSKRVVGKTPQGRFQHEVEHGPRRPSGARPDLREAASRQYSQRPRPEQRRAQRFEERFDPRASRDIRREPQRPGRPTRPHPDARQGRMEGPREPRRQGESMERRGSREAFEREAYQSPVRRVREPQRGGRPQRANQPRPTRQGDERFRR
ncbi:DUF6542 domain-containing protein [Corynebacterium gerontici]|uniref:DUF6542 domain-containing protein n=1 Tax=Corynebacterium gerontici TaxID=2079234 RepID=A0A3G6J509_9CORY|nr:hypothetical protein CGERO_04035 [Corynebacterium gerontici]